MYLILILCLTTTAVLSLKCRTREHMKQQQDFYNLASNCMKSSMNLTQTSPGGSWDYRQNRHHNRHYENTYETNRQHENRYDRNKINFSNSNEMSKSHNTCPDEYFYRNTDSYKEESRYPRHKEKRETVAVQKYNRKNSTSSGSKNKSPLDEIGACVIHCIFKEMKMLNNDNKADRLAMTNVMTSRIRDPELKEFIQDSVEECFDIMDTEQSTSEGNEEQCDFSKKLILCLEEKAKRGCEDWEIRENTTNQSDFSFNKEDENRNRNENQNQQGYFNSKFNNRHSSFNMGQRRS